MEREVLLIVIKLLKISNCVVYDALYCMCSICFSAVLTFLCKQSYYVVVDRAELEVKLTLPIKYFRSDVCSSI